MFLRLLVVLSVLGSVLAGPVYAEPMDELCDEPTVSALHHCVHHMAAQGLIDSPGVANSLLMKLEAAAAALDRGQVGVAVNQLEAFSYEVKAQAGRHIDTIHAAHLQDHARRVLATLESQSA